MSIEQNPKQLMTYHVMPQNQSAAALQQVTEKNQPITFYINFKSILKEQFINVNLQYVNESNCSSLIDKSDIENIRCIIRTGHQCVIFSESNMCRYILHTLGLTSDELNKINIYPIKNKRDQIEEMKKLAEGEFANSCQYHFYDRNIDNINNLKFYTPLGNLTDKFHAHHIKNEDDFSNDLKQYLKQTAYCFRFEGVLANQQGAYPTKYVAAKHAVAMLRAVTNRNRKVLMLTEQSLDSLKNALVENKVDRFAPQYLTEQEFKKINISSSKITEILAHAATEEFSNVSEYIFYDNQAPDEYVIDLKNNFDQYVKSKIENLKYMPPLDNEDSKQYFKTTTNTQGAQNTRKSFFRAGAKNIFNKLFSSNVTSVTSSQASTSTTNSFLNKPTLTSHQPIAVVSKSSSSIPTKSGDQKPNAVTATIDTTFFPSSSVSKKASNNPNPPDKTKHISKSSESDSEIYQSYDGVNQSDQASELSEDSSKPKEKIEKSIYCIDLENTLTVDVPNIHKIDNITYCKKLMRNNAIALLEEHINLNKVERIFVFTRTKVEQVKKLLKNAGFSDKALMKIEVVHTVKETDLTGVIYVDKDFKVTFIKDLLLNKDYSDVTQYYYCEDNAELFELANQEKDFFEKQGKVLHTQLVKKEDKNFSMDFSKTSINATPMYFPDYVQKSKGAEEREDDTELKIGPVENILLSTPLKNYTPGHFSPSKTVVQPDKKNQDQGLNDSTKKPGFHNG